MNFFKLFKKIIKKKKKAVSPLIATIVLISFTIAIGSLVINWGKQFITAQTQGLQQAGVECQKENVQIVTARWDNKNQNLTFTIRNIGEVAFETTTVNVYTYDGNVYSNNSLDITLNVSQVKTFSAVVKGVNTSKSKIQYIEIPSSKCTQNLYYYYNVQQ